MGTKYRLFFIDAEMFCNTIIAENIKDVKGMAENEKKLIGTLQLNSGNVISTIEKVNKA